MMAHFRSVLVALTLLALATTLASVARAPVTFMSAALTPVVFTPAAFTPVAHADEIEDEARRIGRQLQCPVCNGASVADSPSELAGQMRNVIRRKLEDGERPEAIVDYFVARYGEGVLIEPPRRGIGLVVWLGPVVVLALGGLVLTRVLRSWLRPRWSLATAAPGAAAPPASRAAHVNGTARVQGTAHVNGTARVQGTAHVNGTAHSEPDPAMPEPVSPLDRARAELDRYRREA